MRTYLKLFFLNPLIVILSTGWLVFLTIDYLEHGINTWQEQNTFEICKSFEGVDFVDCFKKNNDSYKAYLKCKMHLDKSKDKEFKTIADITCPVFQGNKNSLADKLARDLMDSPEAFRLFVKSPKLFCNEEQSLSNPTAEYFLAKFDSCNEEIISSNYSFTKSVYGFSKGILFSFLLFSLPVIGLLVFWIRRNNPFLTEINNAETFVWLRNQKKFRTALIASIFWMVLSFIVLFGISEFETVNPFDLWRKGEALRLWGTYFISLYPILVILISYFIYTAEDE